jgi:nucleotide-binding universal stress UspA family protein
MPSLHSIVAATDFSEFAERAVRRAARIARQHHAELHLLHVVRPLDLYPGLTLGPDEFGQQDQDLQQQEQTRLEAMASSLSGEFGIRIHPVTRIGRAHAEIAAYAQSVSADLVVAGARGESSLMDLILGSTASRLLRLAACPVLIVRNPADGPYRRVLAPVDFSPVAASVVSHALSLADGAQVEVLYDGKRGRAASAQGKARPAGRDRLAGASAHRGREATRFLLDRSQRTRPSFA